ncbi:MAG: winged helix-turn-helix domain-containing protein [Rhizomicrobium sp.]
MNERFVRAGVIAHVELGHEQDFALGPVQVRPSRREIAGETLQETVEPRVMQVLVALARAKGDILTRDDLIESCWDGVIVGEDAINRCIGRLRKLAETSGNAFSIETVPRVGYRLKAAEAPGAPEVEPRPAAVAELALGDAPLAASFAVAPTSSPALPKAIRPARPTWAAAVSAVAVLVLVGGGLAMWRLWPQASAAPVEASVAVLPFVNMSGNPKEKYFSDGFSEELTNHLANEPHLNVASRTSSFAFRGKSENIETIARALNVHAVVEGSVREAGDRVRITAQLIDASDGYHLWSADYTRNLTDILTFQGKLARAIAAALTHRLVPAPGTPPPKIDPATYRLFLKGLDQFDMPVPQGWRMALATFRQVTERAPDFSDGFARLAISAADLAWNYDAAPGSGFALAGEAAQHALSLDPRNMLARFVLGGVALATWNWRLAAHNFRMLRSQNPDNISTIGALWNYYALLGFPDVALAQWRRLYAIQPDLYRSTLPTVWALDQAGRFQEEIGVARAQLVRHPRDAYRLTSVCGSYALTGQIAEARVVEERYRSLLPNSSSDFYFQECELAIDRASGNRAEITKLLQLWESQFPDKFQHPAWIAVNYVLLGEFDRASDWFERAYEVREPLFFGSFYRLGSGKGFDYEKAFEKYRKTPGYKALAAKPLFKEFLAEHDRIAAALAAHRDPLN